MIEANISRQDFEEIKKQFGYDDKYAEGSRVFKNEKEFLDWYNRNHAVYKLTVIE
jgi:hypothetical protein